MMLLLCFFLKIGINFRISIETMKAKLLNGQKMYEIHPFQSFNRKHLASYISKSTFLT